MNKKKVIVLIIILIIIVAIIIGFLLKKNDKITEKEEILTSKQYIYVGKFDLSNTKNVKIKDNEKYNISNKISSEHKYVDYSFNNMKIYTKDEICYIEFDFSKLTNLDDKYIRIYIDFLDNKGNLINFIDFDTSGIKKGETKKIKLAPPFDVSNAYDYKAYWV